MTVPFVLEMTRFIMRDSLIAGNSNTTYKNDIKRTFDTFLELCGNFSEVYF
jgi:hypothetical protein